MRARLITVVIAGSLAPHDLASAQDTARYAPIAERFVDSVTGLTLEEAIAQALERGPSLRAVRTEMEVVQGMRRQAQLRPNPTTTFMQQTEPAGTDSQTRVEVQWPLDLFRKTGRVTVAEREVETTRHAIADRERLVAADLRMKYGELAAAVRELAVADDLVAATARQHELVRARVEEGATPPLERDMLRVELQRLESDRILQAGRAEQALIDLKRLLGVTPDTVVKLRDSLEHLVQREAARPISAAEGALEQRPDLRGAEAQIQLAEARIDQARREGRFDVSVFGMYMRMDAGFPQQGFTSGGDLERVRGLFHYVAGGAMVTVPLRNRNQGEVQAAQARRAGAMAQRDDIRLTAQAEIAAAQARDESARQAVASYTAEARGLAKQNLDVVGQTYELGRMRLFEVLAEQRRYLDLERAYTNALREAYEARQALRRALGDVR